MWRMCWGAGEEAELSLSCAEALPGAGPAAHGQAGAEGEALHQVEDLI